MHGNLILKSNLKRTVHFYIFIIHKTHVKFNTAYEKQRKMAEISFKIFIVKISQLTNIFLFDVNVLKEFLLLDLNKNIYKDFFLFYFILMCPKFKLLQKTF